MKNKILITSSILLILTSLSFGIKINFIDEQKVQEESVKEQSEEHILSTFITDEMIKNSSTTKIGALVSYSTAPENIKELADNIAIVKIISLDGASMKYDGLIGMTYGTMLINNIIKGNLKSGDVVSYIKPGGMISMEEWESYQPEEANKKREQLRKENNNNVDLKTTYINTLVEDDVEVELGKTYLAYLKYNQILDKYEIIGLGNGFREVNIKQEKSFVSLTKIVEKNQKIKNNITNVYESLSEYIEEYIK